MELWKIQSAAPSLLINGKNGWTRMSHKKINTISPTVERIPQLGFGY